MPDTPGAEGVAEVTRLFLQCRNPVGGGEEAETAHRIDDEAFEFDASIIGFSLEHVADETGGKSEIMEKPSDAATHGRGHHRRVTFGERAQSHFIECVVEVED